MPGPPGGVAERLVFGRLAGSFWSVAANVIPVLTLDTWSDTAFFREHVLGRREPVVLRGAVASWPAASWTPEGLATRFPNASIRYESWFDDDPHHDPLVFQDKQRSIVATLREY